MYDLNVFKIIFRLFQKLLVEIVESRNDYELQFVLEDLKICPDQKIVSFGNLTIFEKILMKPKSGKLVELCLQNGSCFYEVTTS